MNKFAFLSSFLTLILSFFQFIPLGIVFGSPGVFSNWICSIFRLINPIMTFNDILPLELLSYEDIDVFLWGVIDNGNLIHWINFNIISFIFLFLFSIIATLSSGIAAAKSTEFGNRMNKLNLVLVSFIIVYIIIGLPIYSLQIIGFQLSYFDIFLYTGFGFYLIIIDLVMAIIANFKSNLE